MVPMELRAVEVLLFLFYNYYAPKVNLTIVVLKCPDIRVCNTSILMLSMFHRQISVTVNKPSG